VRVHELIPEESVLGGSVVEGRFIDLGTENGVEKDFYPGKESNQTVTALKKTF